MTVNTDELNARPDLAGDGTGRPSRLHPAATVRNWRHSPAGPGKSWGYAFLSDIPQMTAVDLPDLASAGGFSMTGCVKIST